jgi:hypothetical protein
MAELISKSKAESLWLLKKGSSLVLLTYIFTNIVIV